jgi:hypothetical protein
MPSKTFSVDFETSGFRKASRQMSEVGDEASSSGVSLKKAGQVGAAAIGAITTAVTGAVAGIAKLTKNATEYARQVDNAAAQSGLAAENIQEIAFAAEQTSGAQFDSVRDGLKELAIRSEEAANGTGEAKEAFDELGISQQFLEEASTAETFRRVREELQGASAGMRTFAAETIFGGEAGEKLVETLGLSTQEMQKLRSQAQETGKVLSGDQVQALDQTRKAWNRIKSTFTGVGRTIAVAMLPAVKQITPLVQQAANQVQSFFSGVDASAVRSGMQVAIRWTRQLWAVTREVGEGLIEIWNGLVSGISQIWAEWGTFITQRTGNILQGLETAFFSIAGVIQGVWETLVGVLTGNWTRAWQGIKTALRSAAIAIVDQIAQLVQSVLNNLGKLSAWVPGFGDNLQSTFDFASSSVSSFRDRLNEAAEAGSGLQSVWDGFAGGDFGGSGAGGFFNLGGEQAEQPGQASLSSGGGGSSGEGGEQKGILQIIREITPEVQKAQGKLSTFQQAGKQATNAVAQGFNRISTGLGKAVAGVISGKNAFKSFGKAAVRALKNVLSQLVALIPKLAIISGLKSIFGIASGGITSIGGVLTEAVPFLDSGGTVLSDGIAKVHKGEIVGQPSQVRGAMAQQSGQGGTLKAQITMDELVFALDRNLRARGKSGLL